ncbi:hypothetical protein PHK61_13960 [Actinomycetospora lutea]|uniref:hypothetical protein n=1 Tax=Actinomycetospora lutea TaxID=663604 RepID=UPI0023656A69|nr:hypothetical protein [Actinomycetospora lutea]MDD7939524.1 hypothetical protein [Actinomycetospora lutea]
MSTTAASPSPTRPAPPETLDDDPPVRLIMSPLDPVEVPETLRVASALDLVRRLAADHLVTFCRGRVRALAEVDLLRHLEDGGSRPALRVDPVSDVARPVTTIGSEMRRSRAAELLLTQDPPILVVTVGGRPAGLLDAAAVLRSVARGL